MSTLDRMLIFTRVTELASFTQAAEALGLPKATVSNAVQMLEAELGTRLLNRTTRKVQPTQDGRAYYERCKDLLADVDEVQTMFQQRSGQTLRGRVRIDMSTGMARHAVFPRLPELLAQHPLLELEISSTERRVDLVREGFDCVIRAGAVMDTSLIARPLPPLQMVNLASPAYLREHGTPTSVSELTNHRLVHYASTLGGRPDGFEYLDGAELRSIPMDGAVTVNNGDAYIAACRAGLGIIQAPVVGLRDMLAQGLLVPILPQSVAPPMAQNLLYVHRRNLSQRVRVVMDWLADVVTDHVNRPLA